MRSRLARLAGPGLALVLAGTVAAAAACSSTTPTATTATADSGSTIATTASTSRRTRGPDESQGAFVFRTQCAGCHGTQGEGNLGPDLVGIADRMTEADQLALVRTGRGRMPPFSQGLSEDDISAVVAYTRTQLG